MSPSCDALPQPPPALYLAFAALVQRVLPRRAAAPASDRAALACAVGSGVLLGACLVEFARRRTTANPLRVDNASTLVVGGLNRWSRNPMYVAMTGLLVAHAIQRRSVSALVPVVAYAVVLDRGQIHAEEEALRVRFGAEYDAYAARVPRWLGVVGTPRQRH